jgi:hypothetical protein
VRESSTALIRSQRIESQVVSCPTRFGTRDK